MEDVVKHHPVVGELRWVKAHNSWEGTIEFLPGCHVAFDIVAEDEWADADPSVLFEAAASFLEWARQAESLCRERIADDLLDLYNGSWADEDPNEGPPSHTRAEFLTAIRPTEISLYHTGMSSWCYNAGDLFAGHGIWLVVAEDRTFKGKASLVG